MSFPHNAHVAPSGEALPTAKADRLAYITLLRYPLALGVVFIHSMGAAPQWQTAADLTLLDWLKLLLSSALPSVAVSCFFVLSGFLFFRSWKSTFSLPHYLRQLRQRAQTLLLPYVLWNLLAWLAHRFGQGRSWIENWEALDGWNFLWGEHAIGTDLHTWWGNAGHLTAPTDVPLWFLRDLMLLTLLAPLIYILLRRPWRWLCLTALLIAYATHSLPYLFGTSASAIVMFSLGAAVALAGKDLAAPLRPYRHPIWVAFGLLLGTQIFGKGQLPTEVLNIVSLLQTFVQMASFITAADALAHLASKKQQTIPRQRNWATSLYTLLQTLAPSSFFLYAAHTVPFLHLTDRALQLLLPHSSTAAQMLHFLLLAPLTAIVCTLLYFLLRRYLPQLSAPLLGAR